MAAAVVVAAALVAVALVAAAVVFVLVAGFALETAFEPVEQVSKFTQGTWDPQEWSYGAGRQQEFSRSKTMSFENNSG